MPKPIWHTRRTLLLGLGAGAALAGCTTPERSTLPAEVVEYRLDSGDQIRVVVFGEPALSGDYAVNGQGTIAFPLIGEITAVGHTPPEFADRLAIALQEYLRTPNVSVEVANYRPFFILGEVQRPGSYAYSPNLTVLNAIATAGGFTYRANRNRIYIKHASEEYEREYRLTSVTRVLPGDTLRIGERLF